MDDNAFYLDPGSSLIVSVVVPGRAGTPPLTHQAPVATMT